MKPIIYLIGVGNYTEVIIELAQDCGYEVKGLYHYNQKRTGEMVMGIPIIGCTLDVYKQNIRSLNFAVTIGENKLRSQIAEKLRSLGANTPILKHPTAFVSPSAVIGTGCFISLDAKICTKSSIGNDCVLDFSCIVNHHATVDDGCYLAPLAMVGTYCIIGKRVLLGMNSLILPLKLTLGDDCIVGAKANVTKSFPENTVLIGNPAKPLIKK